MVHAIKADSGMPGSTKRLAMDYMDYMRAKGLNDRTLQKNLYCIAVFFKLAGRK